MAKREVLKERRHEARDRHVFSSEFVAEVMTIYEQMASEFDSYRPLLTECLKELDDRTRQAIDLRYIDDLRPANIAERLNVTPGAARVLLHRARSALRECVERRLSMAALSHMQENDLK